MLSVEQQAVWDLARPHEYTASDGQTPAQALRFAVESYLYACQLDGVPLPDEQLVCKEIARRQLPDLPAERCSGA